LTYATDADPILDPSALFESSREPDPADVDRAWLNEALRAWKVRYNDAPFTVLTLISAAENNPRLFNALQRLAPGNYGPISPNKLTRRLRVHEVPGLIKRIGDVFYLGEDFR